MHLGHNPENEYFLRNSENKVYNITQAQEEKT